MKKLLTTFLSALILLTTVPVNALAEPTIENTIWLEETQMDEYILHTDSFYLASVNATIEENSERSYLLRIGRGGNTSGEADVTVNINDYNARYGTDYTVSLLDGYKAKKDEDMTSFMDLMSDDYEVGQYDPEVNPLDEAQNDEQLQQELVEAINDLVEFVEDETDLEPADEQYSMSDIVEELKEELPELENVEKEEKEHLEELEEIVEEVPDTEEVVEEELEPVFVEATEVDEQKHFVSELRQQYVNQTGDYSDPQILESDGSTVFDEVNRMADMITTYTRGAYLDVHFEAGEQSKFLVITPKNNNEENGERYFYITLSDGVGAEVSVAYSCAFTIVDDEQVQPCFTTVYDIEQRQDSVVLYFRREGCLNQISDIAVKTTGNGSGVMGRDYSGVDTHVLFPMGIPEMSLQIPISTAYLTTSFNFEVAVEADQNAVIDEEYSLFDITVGNPGIMLLSEETGEEDERPTGLGAASGRTLDQVIVGKEVDLSAPIGGYRSSVWKGNNYGGVCEYETNNERFRTMWKRDSFFSSDWSGKVTLMFNMWTYNMCASGAQVEVQKNGDCAELQVGLGLMSEVQSGGTLINGNARRVYESKSGINRSNRNFFDPQNPTDIGSFDEYYCVKLVNKGNCSDCNNIYYYAIRPIMRWYQFTFVHSSSRNDIKFLNEDGSYFVDDNATRLYVVGANTETPSTMLTYYGDQMTLIQNLDATSADPYLSLKELSLESGKSIWTFNSTNTNTYSYEPNVIQYNFFGENGNDVKYRQIPESTGRKDYYGVADIYTTFDYKNSTLKLNKPEGIFANVGTLNVSTQEKDYGTYTYHKGDKIRVTANIDPKVKGEYRFAGIEVKAKINATDDKYFSVATYYADENGAVYLDQSKEHRLQYEYYEITPVFEYMDNGIVLRIKEADFDKLDKEYGILKDRTYSTKTIDGETYKEAVLPDVTVREIYSLPVKTTSDNYAPIWKISGDDREYAGSVFYYEAKSELEYNVINLSVLDNKEPVGDVTISGQVARYVYNALTKTTEMALRPYEGACMVAADGSAITDPEGRYSIKVKAPLGYNVRYLSATDGHNNIRENKIESSTITDNFIVNSENASILSNIEIACSETTRKAGSVFTIYGDKSDLFISDQGGKAYTFKVINEDGTITEKSAVERITSVNVIVKNDEGKEHLSYYVQKKNNDDQFAVTLEHAQIQSGDKLYLQITTNRNPSGIKAVDDKGNPTDFDKSTYTYNEVFTGYSFANSSLIEIPVLQKFNAMSDITFVNLPFVSNIGYYINFPYVHVNFEKREDEYLLSVGVSVMDIVDKVKQTHINQYNNGGVYNDMFSKDADGLIDGWKKGIKESTGLISDMQSMAKKGIRTATSLGGFSWRFNVALGAYMKFSPYHIEDGKTDKTVFMFTGAGGYIGVQGGFRFTVYGTVPVIMIPWYFGIQVDAMINGFFGASVDPEKVVNPITFEDAKETSIDMGGLDYFDSSVKMVITGAIFVGVGICGTIGLRGGGTINVMCLWEPTARKDIEHFGSCIVFTAGFWADLFVTTIPLQYSFPDLRFGSIKHYKQNTVEATNTQPENMDFEFRAPYTQKESEWKGSEPIVQSGFKEITSKILAENPYEHPESQLYTLNDGRIVLVFVDDNSVTDVYRRTNLYISVFDGNIWSDPVVIDTGDKAVFSPNISGTEDVNRIVVAYAGLKEDVDTNSNDISDYLTSMEIFYSVITINDDNSINIVDSKKATDDMFYDSVPIIVYDKSTNENIIFYQKAEKTSLTPKAMDLANPYVNGGYIAYKHIDLASGNVGEEKFLVSEIGELMGRTPAIGDLKAETINGYAVIVYTADMDSNINTNTDKEIIMQLYSFAEDKLYNPIKLTDDAVADSHPQLVKDLNDSVYLFWYRDNRDIVYINISEMMDGYTDSAKIKGVIADDNGKLIINPAYLNLNRNGSHTEDEKGLSSLYSTVNPGGKGFGEYNNLSTFKVATRKTAANERNNIYLVWVQVPDIKEGNPDCVELYATAMINEESKPVYGQTQSEVEYMFNEWSLPYKLTDDELYIDEPAITITSDGKLVAVFNQYDQVLTGEDDNPVIFNDFVLKSSIMNECGSISVTEVVPETYSPVKSDDKTDVSVNLVVTNTGLDISRGHVIEVYLKDANNTERVESITSYDHLLPGESVQTNISLSIDKVLGKRIYTKTYEYRTVEYLYENFSEFLSEEFTRKTDMVISDTDTEFDGNKFYLTFTATNNGNTASTDNDHLRVSYSGEVNVDDGLTDTERVFADMSVAGINPGESKTYRVELNVPESLFENSEKVKAYATILSGDKDENIGRSVTLNAFKPMSIKINGKDISEGIELHEGESISIEVETYPTENKGVTLFSQDGSVVDYKDGKLVGLSEGITTVFGAIEPHGYVFGPVNVTVLARKPEPTPDPTPENNVDPKPVVSKTVSETFDIRDSATNEPVVGNKMSILDVNNNVVASFETGEEPVTVKGLKRGEKYTLVCDSPAEGYITPDPVTFTAGLNQKIGVMMKYTRVFVGFKDENGNFISGLEVSIFDESGKLVCTFVTGNEAEIIEKLPVGKYTMRVNVDGEDIEITFTVLDTNGLITAGYDVDLDKEDENPEKDTDPVDNPDKSGSYLPVVLGGTGILLAGIIIILLLTKKKKCPNCGKKVDKDDEICPHCGYDLTDKK